MAEPEGQRQRGASPEETGGHAFVAPSGAHNIYLERQHSRSTESHDGPPVELDDSDYEEIREAIGRGASTLLLGTSTRSLKRNLDKVMAAQRTASEPQPPQPEPETELSQVEVAVKGSSGSYGRLLLVAGAILCIAFLVITVALGDASWLSRLAVSIPVFVLAPIATIVVMRLMIHYTRVGIDELPTLVRKNRGHTILINDSYEKKEKHPVEASAKNHD
jgi:hypothetical protein